MMGQEEGEEEETSLATILGMEWQVRPGIDTPLFRDHPTSSSSDQQQDDEEEDHYHGMYVYRYSIMGTTLHVGSAVLWDDGYELIQLLGVRIWGGRSGGVQNQLILGVRKQLENS